MLRDAEEKCGARPVSALMAFARRSQLPWFLTLVPVGSLLLAALLVALLGRLVPVPPTPRAGEAAFVERPAPRVPVQGVDDARGRRLPRAPAH